MATKKQETTTNVCSYALAMGKNAKSVDELIARAEKLNKSGREAIQVAAIGVLVHAEKTRDWTKARTLVDCVEGANTVSLVAWFVKYGGLVVGKDDAGDETFIGWSGKEHIRENFASARSTPWWNAKKMSPYKGFDLMGAVQQQVTAANNALKKLEKVRKTGDDALVAEMESMIKIDHEHLRELQAFVSARAAA